MDEFPFEAFRSAWFADGIACPRCGDNRISAWGQFRGRRRYRCGGCGRTFSDFTGSPFAYLKRIDAWPRYAACLRSGRSVRTTARLVGIHKDTAFRWRHHFLAAMKSDDVTRACGGPERKSADAVVVPLVGRIHVGERWLRESRKGDKQLDRPARRFGEPEVAPDAPRAWVLVAKGERGGVMVLHVGRSPARATDLQSVLAPLLRKGLTLTDAAGPYGKIAILARKSGCRYGRLGTCADVRADLVGDYWTDFRVWLKRFRGVATRYLGHYLFWRQWIGAKPPWRVRPPPWLSGTTLPADTVTGKGGGTRRGVAVRSAPQPPR